VKLELVLIPAGKFVMGTPEPKTVDVLKKIVVGETVVAVGVGTYQFAAPVSAAGKSTP